MGSEATLNRTVRSPTRFFLLVVALAVPLWVAGAISRRRLLPGLGVNLPISALIFLCPLLAALILVGREEGRPGIRRLLTKLLQGSRLRGPWVLPTVFLMPLIYGLSYLLHRALGRNAPVPHVDPVELAVLSAVFLFTAATEETGWMGYAADPLQEQKGAIEAALLLGLVWSGIHVIPDLQGGQSWRWIVGQRSFSVALRVLIVWLYNNTGRTLTAPVLFHASDNVSVFTLFPGDSQDQYNPAITAVITAVAALIVGYLWGPRTLARFRWGR
jgi:hypothetical protein